MEFFTTQLMLPAAISFDSDWLVNREDNVHLRYRKNVLALCAKTEAG